MSEKIGEQQGTGKLQLLILSVALFFVLLPNVLFLLEWTHIYIGLPLSVLLSTASVYILFQARHTNRWALSCCAKDWFSLFITLLLTLLWVEMMGIHGHVEQAGDWMHRNPIYAAFCEGNCPLYDKDGRYIVYYFAFWLPPAALYKLFAGTLSQETCLFLWYFGCLAMAELALFCRIKGRILIYTGILFCFGSLTHLWYRMIPEMPNLMNLLGCPHAASLDFGLFSPARTHLQVSSNIISGPNHGIALVLSMAIIMSKLLPRRYNGFVAALTIVCAPLNALMMLPMLFFDVWKDRKHFVTQYIANVPLWIAAVALVPIGAFFICQNTCDRFAFVFSCTSVASDYSFFHYQHEVFAHAWARTLQAIVSILVLILPCFLLLQQKLRRTAYFWCSVFIAVLVQCTLLAENEFVFKGSMPMFMLLSMLFVFQLRRCTKKRAFFIYLFIILSGPHIVGDFVHRHWWRYSWNPEIIRKNVAHGSLETLNSSMYATNRFPRILK